MVADDLSEFKNKLIEKKFGVSNEIKANVFKNYSQFIETAKEISRKDLLTCYIVL